MKKRTLSVIAVMASLCFTAPVFAAGGSGHQSGQSGMTSEQSMGEMSSQDLMGMNVVSQDGEDLGQIQDISQDEQTGDIHFVTVSITSGDMQGQDVSIPKEALSFDEQADQITLLVDKSKLENAPQQTADMSDSEFNRELQSYYGVSPAWQEEQQQDMEQEGEEEDSGY